MRGNTARWGSDIRNCRGIVTLDGGSSVTSNVPDDCVGTVVALAVVEELTFG